MLHGKSSNGQREEEATNPAHHVHETMDALARMKIADRRRTVEHCQVNTKEKRSGSLARARPHKIQAV